MTKRTSSDYLYDIEEAIEKGLEFIEDLGFEEFGRDEKTQYALIRAVEIIGEASKKVSIEIKHKYPSIPWREIGRMRDKLIHDYFGVNIEVVWKTGKEDLPKLKKDIKDIIKNEL